MVVRWRADTVPYAQLLEDTECDAVAASADACGHEGGDGHQHCGHPEIVGPVAGKEVRGAWRQGR